jgi:hypothetical protein
MYSTFYANTDQYHTVPLKDHGWRAVRKLQQHIEPNSGSDTKLCHRDQQRIYTWSLTWVLLGTAGFLGRRPSTWLYSFSNALICTLQVRCPYCEVFCKRPCQCMLSPSSESSISLWTVTSMVSPLKSVNNITRQGTDMILPICFNQRPRKLPIDQNAIFCVSIRRTFASSYCPFMRSSEPRQCKNKSKILCRYAHTQYSEHLSQVSI